MLPKNKVAAEPVYSACHSNGTLRNSVRSHAASAGNRKPVPGLATRIAGFRVLIAKAGGRPSWVVASRRSPMVPATWRRHHRARVAVLRRNSSQQVITDIGPSLSDLSSAFRRSLEQVDQFAGLPDTQILGPIDLVLVAQQATAYTWAMRGSPAAWIEDGPWNDRQLASSSCRSWLTRAGERPTMRATKPGS